MQDTDDSCVGFQAGTPAAEETPAWEVRQYGVPLHWCVVLRDDWLAYLLRRDSFVLNKMKDFGEEVDPEALKRGPLTGIEKAMRLCLPELRSGNWIATGICREALNERREIRPEVWLLLDPAKPSLDWLSDRVELNGVFYELIRVRPLEPVPFDQAVIAFADPAIAEDVVESLQVHDARLAHQRLVYAAGGLLPDLRSGRYRTQARTTSSANAIPVRRQDVGADEWQRSLATINGDHVTFQDGRVLEHVVVILPAPLQSCVAANSPNPTRDSKAPPPRPAVGAPESSDPTTDAEKEMRVSYIEYWPRYVAHAIALAMDPDFNLTKNQFGSVMTQWWDGKRTDGRKPGSDLSKFNKLLFEAEGRNLVDAEPTASLRTKALTLHQRMCLGAELFRMARGGEIDLNLDREILRLTDHLNLYCERVLGIRVREQEIINLTDAYLADVLPKGKAGRRN